MSTTTFHQVQHLIDQLTPLEQVRLLEYLTPRIVQAVETIQPVAIQGKTLSETWQAFFLLGDELAKSDKPTTLTLTQTVQEMRR